MYISFKNLLIWKKKFFASLLPWIVEMLSNLFYILFFFLLYLDIFFNSVSHVQKDSLFIQRSNWSSGSWLVLYHVYKRAFCFVVIGSNDFLSAWNTVTVLWKLFSNRSYARRFTSLCNVTVNFFCIIFVIKLSSFKNTRWIFSFVKKKKNIKKEINLSISD